MSLIKQVQTYQCDGCGSTTEAPYEWRSLCLTASGMLTATVGLGSSTEDYCQGCVQKMRASVRGLQT